MDRAHAPRFGVLALQGDFAQHRLALTRLGVESREIRAADALEGLDALILPGGESTALLKLMERAKLDEAIRAFHGAGGTIFGTCAGLILLAGDVVNPEQRSLGLLDIGVERNGYGRQVDSFETDLPWEVDGERVRGVFIRAPRITAVGEEVRVLARHGGDPVLVEGPGALAATFHPELTDDIRIHRYFVESMVGARGAGRTAEGIV